MQKLNPALAALLLATSLTSASAGVRVIDGDTVDFDGIPVRILQIDTPETWKPRCENEYQLGLKAMDRLQELLSSGEVTFKATGYDRFGRVLATVHTGSVDVGDVLLKDTPCPTFRDRKPRPSGWRRGALPGNKTQYQHGIYSVTGVEV